MADGATTHINAEEHENREILGATLRDLIREEIHGIRSINVFKQMTVLIRTAGGAAAGIPTHTGLQPYSVASSVVIGVFLYLELVFDVSEGSVLRRLEPAEAVG